MTRQAKGRGVGGRNAGSARGLRGKIILFTLVGVVGAMCDFSTNAGLRALDVPSWVARGSSYAVGSTVAYYLNSYITFAGSRTRREKLKAALSYIVCFITVIVVNELVLWLFQLWFAPTGEPYPDAANPLIAVIVSGATIAWVISQGIATVLNFVLQNAWVFRQEPQGE